MEVLKKCFVQIVARSDWEEATIQPFSSVSVRLVYCYSCEVSWKFAAILKLIDSQNVRNCICTFTDWGQTLFGFDQDSYYPGCWGIQADTYSSCDATKGGSDWLQMHSAAGQQPKHTVWSNPIKNYLHIKDEQSILEVVVWSAQSPDLSITECLGIH